MVTAYTRMLLGMLQNRIEERLGQMMDTERMLNDAIYASAMLSLARGTLHGQLRILAALLWPLINTHFAENSLPQLMGCPPSRGTPPRRGRVVAFPRPAFA